MAGLWTELGAEVKLSSAPGDFSALLHGDSALRLQPRLLCARGSSKPGWFHLACLAGSCFFLSIARSMGNEECDSQRALQFQEVHEGAKL